MGEFAKFPHASPCHRSRAVLRGRRLLHRPVAASRSRRDHARARRSRALGLSALSRLRRRARVFSARASVPTRPSKLSNSGNRSTLNGVRVSLHPAGHILGSAQIRIEYGGEVWVVSGDYKTDPDPTCTPFELVRCHTFITESTFGLPIYRWRPQAEVFAEMRELVARRTRSAGAHRSCTPTRSARRSACSPGMLDADIGPIYTHGAVERLTRDYRDGGDRASTTRSTPASCRADTISRGSADRRAAIGRGEHVAAPLRRRVAGVRVGLDAGSRRAPPPRGRSRLRALRSRRLAGAALARSRRRAPSACG